MINELKVEIIEFIVEFEVKSTLRFKTGDIKIKIKCNSNE